MASQIKRLELALPCTLTEEELRFRSAMLVETVSAKDEASAARNAAMKEFKDQLTGLDERQRQLAHTLRSGIEERIVACLVQFHEPVEGTKRIVRLDTGEVVKEGAMTAGELQMNIFGSSVEFEKYMRAQVEPATPESAPPQAAAPDAEPGGAE